LPNGLAQPLRDRNANSRTEKDSQGGNFDGSSTTKAPTVANVEIQTQRTKLEQTFGSMVAANDEWRRICRAWRNRQAPTFVA